LALSKKALLPLVKKGIGVYVRQKSDTRCVGLTRQLYAPIRREQSMASKTNPFTFLQQVRSETAKVTWPTRRETMISTVMVFIMAGLAAAFFFLADMLMGWAIGLILNVGF
jgi:preprotein translocase subunit SecE